MTLSSDLFTKPARNAQLDQCEVLDSAHLTRGLRGDAVSRVQSALVALDKAAIDSSELRDKLYGPSTARAVLAYKTKRNIVNPAYQNTADDIVGKMTIKRLDEEMTALEKSQHRQSAFICVDFSGCERHDHPNCRMWRHREDWPLSMLKSKWRRMEQ